MSSPRAATSVATRISEELLLRILRHDAVALVLGHATVQGLGPVTARALSVSPRVSTSSRVRQKIDRGGGRLDVEHADRAPLALCWRGTR